MVSQWILLEILFLMKTYLIIFWYLKYNLDLLHSTEDIHWGVYMGADNIARDANLVWMDGSNSNILSCFLIIKNKENRDHLFSWHINFV